MLALTHIKSSRLAYLLAAFLLALALLFLMTPAPASAVSDYVFAGKWGSFGTGNGQFNYPFGVAVDPSGNVYVADYENNRIQKFNSSGTFLVKWGSLGAGDGQFDGPVGIAIGPAGNVYVSDAKNNRIQKFNSSGTYLDEWGSFGTGNGQFDMPYGVTVGPAGNVYVADTGNNRIQKFNSSGTYLDKWGRPGTGDGQFDMPYGVTVGPAGNVYVADADNNRMQEFNSSGTFLVKWGSFGPGDGQFFAPAGSAFGPAGNVYVADAANNRIQIFTDVSDTIAPRTKLRAPRYSTDVSRTRRFRVYWKAVDPAPTSGLASYDVQYKVGKSGGWRDWLMNTKKNSSNFKGRQGKSYYFRARARDNSGNVGYFSRPRRTIVPHDNNQLIRIISGFGHTFKKSGSRYYLGTVRYSTNAGDAVTYRFKGNSIAVISTKARNRSKAKIYVDGKYKRTVKTAIRRTKFRRAIYRQKFRKISRHTITIVNVGDRDRLDLDGLAVGK